MSEPAWNDDRVERIVGNLLRAGVILAAVVVLAGGVIYLVRHGEEPSDRRVFHGEPAELRTVEGIWKETLALRGRGVIQFGLLLLIATPVARVAFSVFAFARQRDFVYVGLTMIVLGLLLFSLIAGSG